MQSFRTCAVVFVLYAEPGKYADISATSTSLLPPYDHQHISVVRRVLSPSFSDPLFRLVEDISQVALPAVLSVMHGSHEDTSTTVLGGALSPQSLNLPVAVNLVVLEHSQLCLLALVLDLLGRSVHLLLALLGSTT